MRCGNNLSNVRTEKNSKLEELLDKGFEVENDRGSYISLIKGEQRVIYDTSKDKVLLDYSLKNNPLDPECR